MDFSMRCHMIAYNLLLGAFFMIGLPILVPLIVTTAKWRRIVRQRLALWTYPWETQTKSGRRCTIWIHALSVGEVTAAKPLIDQLRREGRYDRIVVSCTTLTGFNTAREILEGCSLCFFPFDWIGAVRRMVDKIDPCQMIIIETDLWPNFLHIMKRRKVPVFLANVRLSDKTYAAYRRLRPAVGILYGALSKIAVQSEGDRQRFLRLGMPAERLRVTGNIKFDAPDQTLDHAALEQWRRHLSIAPPDKVILAGSTHPGEERMLLDAFGRLTPPLQGVCRLIIAPRDPRRTEEILRLARSLGFSVQSLSALVPGAPPPQVVVINRLGVLGTLYGLAHIAFVGGSLAPCGGHNPLEPAAWGKAILFGPDMRDFVHIAQWLLNAGAAQQVVDDRSLARVLAELLADPATAQAMGHRAVAVFKMHKGAVQRTLSFLNINSKVDLESPCR
jgi:3-deoxy-D-manno-octulosonic-acid transferase